MGQLPFRSLWREWLEKEICTVLLHILTIAWHTQEEHENVKRSLEAIDWRKLTLYRSKYVVSVGSIKVLGYCIENRVIKLELEWLCPLREHPASENLKMGTCNVFFFFYYAKWNDIFLDKVWPLIEISNRKSTESFQPAKERSREKLHTTW